jgi:hypothetical protein
MSSDPKTPNTIDDVRSTNDGTIEGTVQTSWQARMEELKYTFTTKDGWIGDYVRFDLVLSQTSANM